MKHSLLALLLLTLTACTPEYHPQSQAKPLPAAADLVGQAASVPTKGYIPSNAPQVKVALLLPLSGDSQAIGNAMLDAANMAIYDSYFATPSDQLKAQVVLLPKDTGNAPGDAVRSTQQAIEQGASFIIGPLFSQSVTAMAPTAKSHNISVLSFSNNKAAADKGIYTFGFLPEQQVVTMAEYAYLHKYLRVAVLAPNDSYGQKVSETLQNIYTKKGGMVAPSELYAPSITNINAAVSRLAAAYNSAGEDRRFQAIFIADGGNQLRNIIDALRRNNIDLTKVKLLGTGLWDDPELSKIPEMRGAWYPSSPPQPYEVFEKRFTAAYGYKPIRLASLAYDAVTLATTLAMNGNGAISPAALTDVRGFNSPANGLVRLHVDGTSERRLAIMEVTEDGPKVLDAAPKAFDEFSTQ